MTIEIGIKHVIGWFDIRSGGKGLGAPLDPKPEKMRKKYINRLCVPV